jgi:ATP-binding cassette subfamily C (CFTR/MRP) protein 4
LFTNNLVRILIVTAIEGIRVVKLLGLERLFEERITAIRKKEIAAIQRVNWFKAGSEATFFVTNMVVSTLIFMVHVGSGGVLSIVNVYSTLALVNTAQFGKSYCVSSSHATVLDKNSPLE